MMERVEKWKEEEEIAEREGREQMDWCEVQEAVAAEQGWVKTGLLEEQEEEAA